MRRLRRRPVADYRVVEPADYQVVDTKVAAIAGDLAIAQILEMPVADLNEWAIVATFLLPNGNLRMTVMPGSGRFEDAAALFRLAISDMAKAGHA